MMEKINISIHFEDADELHVGQLTTVAGKNYFKYDAKFLKTGLNLSPVKLKFDDSIQPCPASPFEDLFGVFNDSLPDGWGRLIVDRYLLSIQKSPDQISALDRLSLVGKNGVGALTYQPDDTLALSDKMPIELTEYAEKSIQILSGQNHEITDEFYRLTGTSGGARPKIQVIYDEQRDALRYGQDVKNENESHWIIKFPSTFDLPDAAQVEYAYFLMAQEAGVEIAPSKLFQGEKGRTFFGTKRFDRIGNKRIHMHSFAGLVHDDFRSSTLDYGHLIDLGLRLEKNKEVGEKILRLAMFNVLTSNQDDHSKNFSFLMDAQGNWRFSPAYDLTFSPNIYAFQTTSVGGKNKNISLEDFQRLAKHFNIENSSQIWKDVNSVVQEWKHYAKQAGVSEVSIKRVFEALKK
jgi:serine/threonine-protein kinase HipA